MSKKLTEQQAIFLEVYFQEVYHEKKDRKKAAIVARDAAGYSENTSPSVILAALKHELLDRSIEELASILPKALSTVEEGIDNPTKQGGARALNAALALLDRAGLTKKEQSEVTVKQPEGLIVIPPKKKED